MSASQESSELYEKLKPIYDEQMEKQIALQNILFEKKNIFKVARMREACAWELMIGIATGTLLACSAQITKNRYYAIPIIPVMMWAGYRFDTAYGTNVGKVEDEVQKILKSEDGLRQIRLPGPPITLVELDQRRNTWKNTA